ncbi:hypothetical protein CHLRE_02g086400v5 [Chlamydomonas reinhardtii]|uniref:JmjC domain-containing protein n=1 Tax=Chlamydomonas reinhardtii TaxID=3055 RepID=A0A2K3E0Z9_CHLRE|nr:uncharacterized protein CHLRE_02g086400v5 [Chlamydomonas reinhardtii]PNW86437.1 hypothetical protein CHLRE_02g086400v5 [Chlamydomonas reinhardtii]
MEALPEGVMVLRLNTAARQVMQEVLKVVKESRVVINELIQTTGECADSHTNGELETTTAPLAEHYKRAMKYNTAGRAMYMHNKALIEVLGHELTHRLYGSMQPLAQDVLVNYPLLYVSDNPKSSSDVLVGSRGSWSPLHQDLPLYCTSAILVLEGFKEFVVVPDEVVPSLRINITSGLWEHPIKHDGHVYQNLQELVHATGGAVLPLRAGDMMIMPPRVFHLARNRAATVSCNFSVCTMESVPLTVAQTLARIEQSPRDVMHFDMDFARLLADCTKMLLQQPQVKPSTIHNKTSRKQLPPVQSILDNSVRLMEWYMTLQCIPNGWVEGFWGPVRTRLLEQLQAALPLHVTPSNELPAAGPSRAAAPASGKMTAMAGAGGGGSTAAVPRPLSTAARLGMDTRAGDGGAADAPVQPRKRKAVAAG